MPAPYPPEFRDDVVRIARSREYGETIAHIAGDFRIHPEERVLVRNEASHRALRHYAGRH